ncbi:MAG: hypothetical protein B6241_10435 [Spirochaetaceae bacterium 4572_59]|nr:MAG: hypothetical protein B6241_10435 [Spirochaetaceae bacterium 4572_59]
MKFKTIFFLFNGIILFSFLFIALMPLFVLGGEYTMIFWEENWFLAVIFLLFISVLDSYFIINWKMFSLLESEDWPGLTAYLEQQIYEKNRITHKNVRMMVNTSLTISNLDKISRLEKEIREKKPEWMSRYGTMLGIPYLLNQNHEEGKAFFKDCLNKAKVAESFWLQWCYSFILLSGKEVDEAESYLKDLGKQEKDPVLQMLSLYLYKSTTGDPVKLDEMKPLKEAFLTKFPTRKSLDRVLNKTRSNNVTVLLLSSILDDSLNWMFETE